MFIISKNQSPLIPHDVPLTRTSSFSSALSCFSLAYDFSALVLFFFFFLLTGVSNYQHTDIVFLLLH